jgi:hypothetical protein
MSTWSKVLTACTLFFLIASACEKVTIEDETFGSIEGFVLHSETDEPVQNANITTTPPTNSILTDVEGTFRLDEIPTGSYSIKVSKNGFQNNSVSVTVREEKVAVANIPIAPEEEEEEDDSGDDGDGDGDDGGGQ